MLVQIKNKRKTQRVKKNRENELLWYDPLKQQLLKFKGGKLIFEYRYDPEFDKWRMLPKAVEDAAFINETVTYENSARSFFTKLLNYNNFDAHLINSDTNGITVEITNDDADDFLYQVSREGLKFEINR